MVVEARSALQQSELPGARLLSDTAASDIDLFVVADQLTLENIYSALAPVEASLERKINPTLYTSGEFADRKAAGNAFLTRVLAGEHLVLIGDS